MRVKAVIDSFVASCPEALCSEQAGAMSTQKHSVATSVASRDLWEANSGAGRALEQCFGSPEVICLLHVST